MRFGKKTDSVAAAALMRKVLPIISLAGSRVRWGADEKRKLFTTLLNMRRHDDAASTMYNYAPNDVIERASKPATVPPSLPPSSTVGGIACACADGWSPSRI